MTRVRRSDQYRGAVRGWRDERLQTGLNVERMSLVHRFSDRFGTVAVQRHAGLLARAINRLEDEMRRERAA